MSSDYESWEIILLTVYTKDFVESIQNWEISVDEGVEAIQQLLALSDKRGRGEDEAWDAEREQTVKAEALEEELLEARADLATLARALNWRNKALDAYMELVDPETQDRYSRSDVKQYEKRVAERRKNEEENAQNSSDFPWWSPYLDK